MAHVEAVCVMSYNITTRISPVYKPLGLIFGFLPFSCACDSPLHCYCRDPCCSPVIRLLRFGSWPFHGTAMRSPVKPPGERTAKGQASVFMFYLDPKSR